MRTSRGVDRVRKALVIASCVGVGLGVFAVQAAAQIPGANYTGDHSGTRDYDSPPGPRIRFDVSATGSSVQNLTVYDVPYAIDVTSKSASIVDHRFTYEVVYPSFGVFPGPSCKRGSALRITGVFDAGQGVVGTIDLASIDCPFNSENIDWYDGPTWSASTQATPPRDTTAPNTNITKHPKNRVVAKSVRVKVTYAFTSTEADPRFQCKLDKRSWQACGTPKSYKVPAGKHTFKVRAKDAAGNLDPSPAKDTFRVIR